MENFEQEDILFVRKATQYAMEKEFNSWEGLAAELMHSFNAVLNELETIEADVTNLHLKYMFVRGDLQIVASATLRVICNVTSGISEDTKGFLNMRKPVQRIYWLKGLRLLEEEMGYGEV